jgi:hypothetical protein
MRVRFLSNHLEKREQRASPPAKETSLQKKKRAGRQALLQKIVSTLISPKIWI